MANLPFDPAFIEQESGGIKLLSAAMSLLFMELYLAWERGEIYNFPGIGLALPMNRNLIGQQL
jgi:hypothetical protein